MTKYNLLKAELLNSQYVWLITGVAGFIGSNLLEELLSLNQKVIGIDNFSTGFQTNIDEAILDAEKKSGKKLSDNFVFYEGDITCMDDCNKVCKGVDFVLHQAALGSVPRSIEDPIKTNQNNIDGFLNILVAAKNAKVKRFVYAASSSTYGDHKALPKVEDVIGNPLSPYAVSKLANELYADVFNRIYKFETIGLRYFNIFGKRQNPNGAYAAVIPKWIQSFMDDSEIYINGDGSTSRDFCYIDNTIQMNILAALTKNDESINQIYNVAHNDRNSLKDLFQLIKKSLLLRGLDCEYKEPIYREFRAGDVLHSQANIDKAKSLLGYKPELNFSQGMNLLIDWYISRNN